MDCVQIQQISAQFNPKNQYRCHIVMCAGLFVCVVGGAALLLFCVFIRFLVALFLFLFLTPTVMGQLSEPPLQ
jgi:hypothetical protein